MQGRGIPEERKEYMSMCSFSPEKLFKRGKELILTDGNFFLLLIKFGSSFGSIGDFLGFIPPFIGATRDLLYTHRFNHLVFCPINMCTIWRGVNHPSVPMYKCFTQYLFRMIHSAFLLGWIATQTWPQITAILLARASLQIGLGKMQKT